MQLKASKIAEVIGAKVTGVAPDMPITTLLTDSRSLTTPSETLFFALRTAGNDGHRHIGELYDAGVRCFICTAVSAGNSTYNGKPILSCGECMLPGAMLMLVPDVLAALQDLAAYVRGLFPHVPVVAITGSRGKTVVKEQLYTMLRNRFSHITRSPRSYNSQTGVPLSIWEMTPDTDLAIFEAGISMPGEMERLQRMLRPDIGIFTSITAEHDEGFDDVHSKVAEKCLLFKDTPVVFAAKEAADAADGWLMRMPRGTAPACIETVDGGNLALSATVARFLCILAGKSDEVDTSDAPTDVTARISVTSTLKNCVLVRDRFTDDYSSLPPAVDFARRNLTPRHSLTVIMPATDMPDPALTAMLARKGVTRLINIGRPVCSDALNIENVESWRQFLDRYSISDFSSEVILVKGESGSGAEDAMSLLEAPRHETVMEVDLGAIVDNFNFFRSRLHPDTGIVAMVKADGYGVGALEIAKTMQAQGAAYLAVAVIDEGVALRRAGITMPIIVMNPIGTNYKALFENRLEPSVFSLRELQLLLDNASRLGIAGYPVHIKLDTGMHRLGFLEEELPALVEALRPQTALHASSIFSHLATADCLDQDEYTLEQLDSFSRMSSAVVEALGYHVKRHILNTAGILRYPQYQYDMVRLGIGLYGVSPIEGETMRTVATLLTSIISVKEWLPGTSIGYGRKGWIEKPTLVATIPIGYADGLNRHLSCGAASFLVKGKMCKVLGNICMDQCMIDITGTDAGIGDTVEIFGNDMPIQRLSDTLGTIPYEILTSISPRVKRIYFRE